MDFSRFGHTGTIYPEAMKNNRGSEVMDMTIHAKKMSFGPRKCLFIIIIIIILVYSLSGNCPCKHGSDFFATAQMPIGGCCGKFCTGDALRPATSSEGGDTRILLHDIKTCLYPVFLS